MNMRIAILLVTLFMVSSTASTSAVQPRLSGDQERRLAGGEVVVLDVLPPGGNVKAGRGGTAVGLVHATADSVWRVLVDYRRHMGLYPHVVGVDVVEADETHSVVRYVLGVGPFSFRFHVNNYADARSHRLEWRLDPARRNDLFLDNWGYWQIEPDPRGVLLTYAMAARTVLPAFLTRTAERDGLVETLKAVRDRAEHSR